ncbi:RNA polymerase II elongation factor ELL isoform X2 [Bombina bombina]|uniref:RNA polymerase II elongation factor ELL isoform X2 n=1 Tax=Bombina bombina TaxID=8345 RepID=UPI00235A8B37|nr:RNA polymerase II elongation factor ELL isoform X2 [Bombina bombina]
MQQQLLFFLCKGSGASLSQPIITFQGNQGYIKIPSPAPGSDDRLRIFAFYLSRESKDKPQSSFECIRQGTSWSGKKQLSCIGSIQDKITICATDESYQLTRDRMSQVEKETWSRTAIEIKPGASHRSKCVKISSKNSLEITKEDSPCNRRPPVFLTPAAKKCSRVGDEQRPLQEWLIHILALRPHRQQDIILRLEKSNAVPREQTELLSTLDMVGRFNSKDGSYSLKEELYYQVQKDWVGYTPEEKQHILSGKEQQISSSQAFQASQALSQRLHQDPPSGYTNTRIKPDTKRPAPSESKENESCKRVKAPHCIGEQHPSMPCSAYRNCTETNKSHSSTSQKDFQSHKKQNKSGLLSENQHQQIEKGQKSRDTKETKRTKHKEAPPQEHKRVDRNKEKKEQDSSEEEEEEEDDWEEEALLLEKCLCHPEEKQQLSEPSLHSEDVPDYYKKYAKITSQQQRQMYEEDFASDYTEYLELHAKIGKVLEKFVHLGTKMKKFQQGTVEHKVIENRILSEYKKFKKTYPGYREEKIRCEYLHHKLSHIKHMILEYEQNMPT